MRAVIERQLGSPVATLAAVGGGSISSAYWCRLENGRQFFVKAAPEGGPEGMFAQEVVSLRRMAGTGTVRVPEVIAAGDAWLILEWLEPAAESRAAWRSLGAQLARMHRVRGGARLGRRQLHRAAAAVERTARGLAAFLARAQAAAAARACGVASGSEDAG